MSILRLNPEELQKICVEVFTKNGMNKDYARKVADSLIYADLRGVSSHGVVRLKSYMERIKKENWNLNPVFKFTQVFPAVCKMDGDAGFGSLVGITAMEKAIEMAESYGTGIVSVNNSTHFGMSAYYTILAARHDMIGFCCTNGMPGMAHYGSRKGMIGTNPFSVAIPVADQEPLVLDFACSVTARGNISNAKREGKSIPEGWAVDSDGNPTIDAVAALKGSVLPFAGYKGSGIAIVIDLLCGVLSGANYGIHFRDAQTDGPNVGHLFTAINLKALGNPEEIKVKMKNAMDELRQAPLANGFDRIYMPGEIEEEKYLYNKQHGIQIGSGAWNEFCDACKAWGIDRNPDYLIIDE